MNRRQFALQCDLCDLWVHIKCNKLDRQDYAYLGKQSEPWYCLNCTSDIFPLNKGPVNCNEPLRNSPFIETFKNLNKVINDSNVNNEDPVSLTDCQYLDITELNNIKLKMPKSFSMFHLNIASLSKHFDDFNALLSVLNFEFDVIGLSETRFKKGVIPAGNLDLENFFFEHTATESSAGGTGLFISKKLSYKPRPDLTIYKKGQLESTFIEIINKDSSNIIIASIYRHPCMPLEDFNEHFLSTLLMRLSSEHNKRIYLMGDFNVDLLKAENHTQSLNFLNLLESGNLVPKILLPTRVTLRTNTLIDNIFTNQVDSEMISGNLSCTISDHLPQFLIVPSDVYTEPETHNIKMRDMKNFNKENFLSDLRNINWDHLLETDRCDINHSFHQFLSTFNNILELHAPTKTASKKYLKQRKKPWITKGILRSIQKRNIIFREFKKCKSVERKKNLQAKYKTYRNQISLLLRTSKNMHLKAYFEANKKNSRKIWQGIRGLLSLKNNLNSSPNCIVSDGITLTDPTRIANCFNNFFTNIGNKIQNSVHSNHTDFTKYLKNSNENNFFSTPTDPTEVFDVISSLRGNKASGPNSIPHDVLQMVRADICEPLSNLINLSFSTGTYPILMKRAKITPIHKKGSGLNIDNFRPISLLSNINKLFEKLMFKRVYNFLSQQESFFKMQFGFRDKHSTTHALFSLTEAIRKALDDNNFVCGVFIDLKKAFDTVDHNILLKKLEHYGIRGLPNNWFKSYLTDREQYVSINGFESNVLKINIGVPQGSVLGPLLFLIYINDLHNAIKHSLVHHFADDTNLLHVNRSIRHLNRLLNLDLRSLCDWLKANKIALNATKTEVIVFRHPNKALPQEVKLKIDGKKLVPTHSVKYLGVYLDEFLTFKQHILDLISKLRRSNGMLSKIRHFVSEQTLRSIYFSLFESQLTYCCTVWGQKGNTHVDKIIPLQNSALRLITFSNFRASSKVLYERLEILQFRQHVELQNILFVNASLNQLAPKSLIDLFNLRRDIIGYGLRNNLRLERNIVRTSKYGIYSIKYQSILAWNKFVNLGVINRNNWPLSKIELCKCIKSHLLAPEAPVH